MMDDHEAIRSLIARYSHAADDGRGKDFALLFTPDGVLESQGSRVTGREQLAALIESIYEHGIKHFQINTAIQLDTDRATAQTDLLATVIDEQGSWQVMGCGRYEDELQKHDGDWRFARRVCRWHRKTPPEVLNQLDALLASFGSADERTLDPTHS